MTTDVADQIACAVNRALFKLYKKYVKKDVWKDTVLWPTPYAGRFEVTFSVGESSASERIFAAIFPDDVAHLDHTYVQDDVVWHSFSAPSLDGFADTMMGGEFEFECERGWPAWRPDR